MLCYVKIIWYVLELQDTTLYYIKKSYRFIQYFSLNRIFKLQLTLHMHEEFNAKYSSM